MAEYYGLKAIAKRFGVSVTTVHKYIHTGHIPVYRRTTPGTAPYRARGLVWYTHDGLIQAYELASFLRAKMQKTFFQELSFERGKLVK